MLKMVRVLQQCYSFGLWAWQVTTRSLLKLSDLFEKRETKKSKTMQWTDEVWEWFNLHNELGCRQRGDDSGGGGDGADGGGADGQRCSPTRQYFIKMDDLNGGANVELCSVCSLMWGCSEWWPLSPTSHPWQWPLRALQLSEPVWWALCLEVVV